MSTETRKPNSDKKVRPSRAKRVGASVVALLAAGGAYQLAANYQSPQEREAAAAEAEALQSLEENKGKILNSVFVFNEGVKVRKEPLRKSEERADDGSVIDITNEEFTVGKNERLVANRPFLEIHEDGDKYVGFTLHGRETQEEASDNVYYVALSALQNEQAQGEAVLYEEYSLGATQDGYAYNASTGELQANDGRDLASAKLMSPDEAEFLISTLPIAPTGS